MEAPKPREAIRERAEAPGQLPMAESWRGVAEDLSRFIGSDG
ncbi:hypothetical protein THARTR1_11080 [Trichoderma harzianum]|uniref:Uncharacterized protein n=1 Tax=Trichoderma harzianum TaxID=5544 RepID=A0A2K0TF83_TRIHA|nr:hypothetical protein THARTR1_11080 [Trichoderma harzianum]